MAHTNKDRIELLETQVKSLTDTIKKSFKLTKRELTTAEKERVLQHSIDEKIDTLKWKLSDLERSVGPSKYYHGLEQLETICSNLGDIIDKVCRVGDPPITT